MLQERTIEETTFEQTTHCVKEIMPKEFVLKHFCAIMFPLGTPSKKTLKVIKVWILCQMWTTSGTN